MFCVSLKCHYMEGKGLFLCLFACIYSIETDSWNQSSFPLHILLEIFLMIECLNMCNVCFSFSYIDYHDLVILFFRLS